MHSIAKGHNGAVLKPHVLVTLHGMDVSTLCDNRALQWTSLQSCTQNLRSIGLIPFFTWSDY